MHEGEESTRPEVVLRATIYEATITERCAGVRDRDLHVGAPGLSSVGSRSFGKALSARC